MGSLEHGIKVGEAAMFTQVKMNAIEDAVDSVPSENGRSNGCRMRKGYGGRDE